MIYNSRREFQQNLVTRLGAIVSTHIQTQTRMHINDRKNIINELR